MLFPLGERALIRSFTSRLGARDDRLLIGPGDDAAVVRPAGALAVTSTDTTVLGVHLLAGHPRSTPAAAGHRALATALSDLAAMGVPAGEAYVALTVPHAWDDEDVLDAIDAIEDLARRTGTTVAGGDVTSGGTMVITVTVVGWASGIDALLRRSTARVGELVGVTGTLGGSGGGLALLQDPALLSAPVPAAGAEANPDRRADEPSAPVLADDVREALVQRHLRPLPRMVEGVALVAAGVRTGIDLSDGIATDAAHVGRASGVVLAIDLGLLPLQAGVGEVAAALGRDAAELAATAGEDFELLVTAPPGIARDLAGVTWIGEVRAADGGEPGVELLRDGRPVALQGFEHRSG